MKRPSGENHFTSIRARWMTRREAIKGIAAAGISATGLGSLTAACSPYRLNTSLPDETDAPALTFTEIPHLLDETHHAPPGYDARVLVSWGEPLFGNSPAFDASRQTAAAQELQFGYNNDFIAYFPLSKADDGRPRVPEGRDDNRGLLCVNHEYTHAYLMFPGYQEWADSAAGLTKEQIDVELAAHGHSVIEIRQSSSGWTVSKASPYNRRITMHTPMKMAGPAAGHPRLRTSADPSGEAVLGTMGNCAGGVTPWGTVLTSEENFRHNFSGSVERLKESRHREARNHARFDLGINERRYWSRFYDRFHIEREPNEPNRFGWIVEFNPYDPESVPVKRSCLGRFQHEGCSVVSAENEPLVAYSGDDGWNEYIYKFVSSGRYRSDAGTRNSELFDDGILYAARFHDDGSGEWLPLVFGRAPLTPDNGFNDQGDVLIDTRLAADLVGATPMDRPEDIGTSPVTGRTYVMLTKNPGREATDAANPRQQNVWGQVVELLPPGPDGRRDHASARFSWDIFILAGDPDPASEAKARYGAGTSESGWFCNPDNVAFDPFGRMWMATDNGMKFGFHDGLWAAATTGPNRAVSRHFFGCPRGAELCGPCFTPDGRTLFVAVQHPADEEGSSFDSPSTRWPNFRAEEPPRPSVVAITRSDGKIIGS